MRNSELNRRMVIAVIYRQFFVKNGEIPWLHFPFYYFYPLKIQLLENLLMHIGDMFSSVVELFNHHILRNIKCMKILNLGFFGPQYLKECCPTVGCGGKL